MKKLEQFIAAISIFASGLILGYFIDRKPIIPQERVKQARTYIVGDCEVKVDSNNVLLGIECEEVIINKNAININR
jgi:hypothetical protein